MPTVAVLDTKGGKAGEMELSDAIFGIAPNIPVMHEVMRAQLAARRQGTQSTLTRSEVRGGGRKPWRQKGTGRARQSSIRAPHWIKGGVVFAPKPRAYTLKVNKKVRRLALKSALSAQVADGKIIILDELSLPAPKTSDMQAILSAVGAGKKVLLVLPEADMNIINSLRNIKGTRTLLVNTLNVVDLLKCDTVIATRAAVEKIQEVYA
ncbi:MAG: 50S ribosomal protein L4 [Christensenellales bacterium]|jgi:large subunit ribosomal protein L4